MNMPTGHAGAEVLLEHFHRLGDAKDAVPRLRQFILDLAVRGKLVTPAKGDEPSATLLKRIVKDLDSRINSGEFKEPKSFIDFPIEELPFVVPDHWNWVRLITVAEVSYGYAFDSNRFNAQRKGMPLIRIRDISKTDTVAYTDEAYDPFYAVKYGDMLIGMDGDFNIRKWKGGDALLNQRVCRIRDWRHGLVADFMSIPLQMILLHLHGSTSLTTVKHLSAKQLNGVYLPLPPLPEQHRIVAKVDELMALCDRLEAAQQEREQRRKRLTAASWQTLTTESDTNAASFALEQLPALTTRPQQIAALRQTILDLAVRGRLVKQDEKDEPAEVLLKRMATERAKLVEAREFRKTQPLPSVESDERSFEAPTGWSWTRLGVIGDWGSGSTPSRGKAEYYGGKHTWLKSGELNDVIGLRGSDEKVTDIALKECSFRLNRKDDVLIAMYGATIGKLAILGEDAVTNQAVCGCTVLSGILNKYLFLQLLAMRSAFHGQSEGGAQPNISKEKIVNTPFPLPPLAEQRRIVAKVDELMRLCDALEAALVRGEEVKGRLLEAVLASGSEDQTIRRSENGMRAMPGGQRLAAKVVQGGGEVKAPRVYVEAVEELPMAAEPEQAEPVRKQGSVTYAPLEDHIYTGSGPFPPNAQLTGQVPAEYTVKRRPGRPRKSDFSALDKAIHTIRDYLNRHPGWHGKAAILQVTGVQASEWNEAIKLMLDMGVVEREGEKKGARYRGQSTT